MGIYTDLQELAKSDPDEVVRQCQLLLDTDPGDSLALFLMGSVFAEAERFGMAANVFARVCDLRPDKPEAWNNLGMSMEGLKRHDEAMRHFRRAFELERRANFASNIGNCYLSRQEWTLAVQWAHKALKLDPECRSARSVLAMASLAQHDWSTGWDNYDATLGGKFRKETQYQDEDRWDGTPGKTLIVYGEQGLGDEIMYASCVPDVARQNTVVLECDKRLEGLFRRSFPTVHVHGTRREAVDWLDRYQFEGRCSIGTLPKFFRRCEEEFPGTPYLVADEERAIQWRALLEHLGRKPRIGLAWSGGSRHNSPEARGIGLEVLRPLIESMDATWVSLQYRDASEEIERTGLPVRHWHRAVQSPDYDDTAALVSQLDLVIGPHTSVHHLAGGLGVPSLILVPHKTMWAYAKDEFPWYRSAQLVRQQGTWKDTIDRLISHPAICRLR